jgi:DUF1680 family protein
VQKIQVSKSRTMAIIVVAFVMLWTSSVQSAEGQNSKLQAVPFTDVVIADEFWAPRIETSRKATIPHAFKQLEKMGLIDNFAVAGGLIKGSFRGRQYYDSELFKVVEGASYTLSTAGEAALEEYLDEVIAKIAAAQEDDGYSYTWRTIDPNGLDVSRCGKTRWSDLSWSHELYNVGHLYEAAVAHYQATGKRTLLDVAIKNADLIDRVFGPDKKRFPPGHPEIEIGLAKLYRLTGKEKYLKLAKFFLDERGRAHGRKLYGLHSQDHQPVLQQKEAVGHAVRAGYLYCGMADVATLTGDAGYIKAIDRIWENVAAKKLCITGGIGARHEGEAFGDNYELPNATAYNETCAAIANVMWNHRLFLQHADAKYIDVLERVIYNGFLSGVSLSGDEFFYSNPLASDGKFKFNKGWANRFAWSKSMCCPTNVVRFIPSLPGYIYAQRGDILFVNLFVGGSGIFKPANNKVKLTQDTRYPLDGDIKITVEPEHSAEFAIYVRIPGWARNQPVPSDLYRYMNRSDEKVTLEVNSESVALNMDKGFARIRRKWKKGDAIRLKLLMPVRRVLCNEKVEQNRDKVALERGPIVYCAESADNGKNVSRVLLSADVKLKSEYRKELLGGVGVITGGIRTWHLEGEHVFPDKQDFVAIPYYAWSHRGAGEMAVWLPRYFGFPEANAK